MFPKSTAVLFAAFVTMASVSDAARTRWFTTRSCDGGPALDYQNLGCNVCVDPALDWYAVLVDGVSDDQRISSHNQNGCTPASQVGQFYGGPACNTAGATAIRSMWIACPGQRVMNENTTFISARDMTYKKSEISTFTNTDV